MSLIVAVVVVSVMFGSRFAAFSSHCDCLAVYSSSGMMHEPSLEVESHCQSWSVVAEIGESQRFDVQQESDCEDSGSCTTSAVFLCPS